MKCVLSVLFSDRKGLKNQPAISKIQSLFQQALYYLMKHNHPSQCFAVGLRLEGVWVCGGGGRGWGDSVCLTNECVGVRRVPLAHGLCKFSAIMTECHMHIFGMVTHMA